MREGCEVMEAQDGQDAKEKLESFSAELILTDMEMPRADGKDVLAAGLKKHIPVVILTGQGSVEVAVQMMRLGAANFLTKPFTPATLRALLEDTFGRTKASPPAVSAAQPLPIMAAEPHDTVIGEVAPFRRVLDVIQTLADTEATVMLTGESGTGKEVMARVIHNASNRRSGPFVAVNCGAIPEPLLESELFGHAKGAFTGATHSRAGRFQLADGGTILLDEIGDMPLAFQVKLLRVLQERQYEVLGEGLPRRTDVRVIVATHRDLKAMVSAGQFREDLYYRLNVIDIHLPPLRERKADIPLLVEHFMQTANERHNRAITGLQPAVLQAFDAFPWPGNIRQLANVIEKMVVLKRSGELELSDVPLEITANSPPPKSQPTELPADGLDLRQAVAEYEDSLIGQALDRTGGNRNAAAQLLGLNRTTLVEKLRRRKDLA